MKRSLHPDFPVVEGEYQVTDDWSITLDQKYNRRIEDGNLVIWRPGFTIWMKVWKLGDNETPKKRLRTLVKETTKSAFDIKKEIDDSPLRFSYRLAEDMNDDRQAALYCFAVGSQSHSHLAFYFDNPSDLDVAFQLFYSLKDLG